MHIAAIVEKKEPAHVSYGITCGLVDLDAGGIPCAHWMGAKGRWWPV